MKQLKEVKTLLPGWNNPQFAGPLKVAEKDGYFVKSYEDLVEKIAIITFNNPELNLFYRGQPKDYKDGKISSLFPSFYRRDSATRKLLFDKLHDTYIEALIKHSEFKNPRFICKRIRRNPEVAWSILQHYGLDTPLLDITQDRHVAASFASRKIEDGDWGYIYVLGLPNINGHVSYFAYEGLVLVKLQSACPPSAKRPHYQEAYSVGTFPFENRTSKTDKKYKNFACRLVCKFKFDKSNFWDNKHQPISDSELIADDELEKYIMTIKGEVN